MPGRMFRKDGRWWWSVQLPGEARCRARALRASEERIATSDRRTAEAAALNLWRDAVKAEAQAALQAEIKIQSVEKSRAYAFLVDQMVEAPKCSFRQAPWTAPSTFQIQVESDTESKVYEPIEKLPHRPAPVHQVASLHEPDTAQDSAFDLMDILSERPTMQDHQGCECCGSKDFFDEYLQTVETGQKLCPRCVQAMREDTLVADPGASIML